jgi:hypothetical protein
MKPFIISNKKSSYFEVADKLYRTAQEELKKTEYYFNVESEQQTSELLK